jgi:pimeloyl-ACP methyl ester carboxylesterase
VSDASERTAAPGPFVVTVADGDIVDLRRRLAATRWPERATVDGWDQGVPLDWLRDLCAWWADGYDFGFADRLNVWPQHRHRVNGLGVHVLHARSLHDDALPLLLTHGWPGAVSEFLDVIGPLTDPEAHGGEAADAFHVVAPSLPGFGWSDRPVAPGWGVDRIAAAWAELMTQLGYRRYGAHGGDWGSSVTTHLARRVPDAVAGVHVTLVNVGPDRDTLAALTADEQRALDDYAALAATGQGYAAIQSTRPQTIGYALTDSPAGLAGWIAEKYWAWTDHDGDPLTAVDRTRLLDVVSTYWFTATAASSARLYWESWGVREPGPLTVPSGVTIFPREIYRPSRRWVERRYTDLRWFAQAPRGGHFAAIEVPDLLVEQLRGFFRSVR